MKYYAERLRAYEALSEFQAMAGLSKGEYIKAGAYESDYVRPEKLFHLCSLYEVIEVLAVMGASFADYRGYEEEIGGKNLNFKLFMTMLRRKEQRTEGSPTVSEVSDAAMNAAEVESTPELEDAAYVPDYQENLAVLDDVPESSAPLSATPEEVKVTASALVRTKKAHRKYDFSTCPDEKTLRKALSSGNAEALKVIAESFKEYQPRRDGKSMDKKFYVDAIVDITFFKKSEELCRLRAEKPDMLPLTSTLSEKRERLMQCRSEEEMIRLLMWSLPDYHGIDEFARQLGVWKAMKSINFSANKTRMKYEYAKRFASYFMTPVIQSEFPERASSIECELDGRVPVVYAGSWSSYVCVGSWTNITVRDSRNGGLECTPRDGSKGSEDHTSYIEYLRQKVLRGETFITRETRDEIEQTLNDKWHYKLRDLQLIAEVLGVKQSGTKGAEIKAILDWSEEYRASNSERPEVSDESECADENMTPEAQANRAVLADESEQRVPLSVEVFPRNEDVSLALDDRKLSESIRKMRLAELFETARKLGISRENDTKLSLKEMLRYRIESKLRSIRYAHYAEAIETLAEDGESKEVESILEKADAGLLRYLVERVGLQVYFPGGQYPRSRLEPVRTALMEYYDPLTSIYYEGTSGNTAAKHMKYAQRIVSKI